MSHFFGEDRAAPTAPKRRVSPVTRYVAPIPPPRPTPPPVKVPTFGELSAQRARKEEIVETNLRQLGPTPAPRFDFVGRTVTPTSRAEFEALVNPDLVQTQPVGLLSDASAFDNYYGTGSGGGGGGGGSAAVPTAPAGAKEIHEFEWKDVDFNVESGRAPTWWVGGRVPKQVDDAADPRVNFMMTMNAMIPYMSPEDQRNAAAQLYAMDANHWSEYKPEKLTTTVPKVGAGRNLATSERRYFQSRQRNTGAVNMLNQLRQATVEGNRWKISPGYTWLQQVLGVGESFGGGESRKTGGEIGSGQTRSDYLAQLGALDPLLAQAKSGELGGFGAIGRMLSSPFFSAGSVRPTTRGPSGRTFFGQPNQLLFG